MKKICEKPIQTYGMNGKTFLLKLKHGEYYGYSISQQEETVKAVWDSLNECFYEKETGSAILQSDIVEWDVVE